MKNSKIIRLFIGTYTAPKIFHSIYAQIKNDFNDACRGKWVEPENLHFTYLFIGDFPVFKLMELKDKLSPVLGKYDSTLRFSGINDFSNISRPKLLHVPVQHDGILDEIFNNLAIVLSAYSILPENKRFAPHVTLQRIKDIEKEAFAAVIDSYRDYEFGIMNEFEVCLIESRLTSKGPIYKIHSD